MLRISASLGTRLAVDDPRQGARWLIERAAAARDAGLDALFVGDHHGVAAAKYYQNGPLLGRLLAEWGGAPAGALYLLPLWHPVLVAEQVGTLAALCRGRFIMQCALGGDDAQFAAMGVERRERVARFEAALPLIRQLLAGEEVTSEEPHRIDRARIGLVPAEPVEVWAGGHAPAAVDRAGRLADGWICAPRLPTAEARALGERFREGAAAQGRTPTAVAVRRDVHVGADADEAEAVFARVIGADADRGERIVGGPHEVAEAFAHLAEQGFTDVVIRHFSDDQREVLASYERLSEVRELLST